MQSDAHTMLQRNDIGLVDRHADSVVLSVPAESHAQTKEIHGARSGTGTTVALAAPSEQRSEAAKRIQTAPDDEETRMSLTTS